MTSNSKGSSNKQLQETTQIPMGDLIKLQQNLTQQHLERLRQMNNEHQKIIKKMKNNHQQYLKQMTKQRLEFISQMKNEENNHKKQLKKINENGKKVMNELAKEQRQYNINSVKKFQKRFKSGSHNHLFKPVRYRSEKNKSLNKFIKKLNSMKLNN
tara:strand:- start:270 stop:737 length:468 start_codon:yes stop_codon:yes gene_type:complete